MILEVARQYRDFWRNGSNVVVVAFVLWLVPSIAVILKYAGLAGLIFLSFASASAIIGLTSVLGRRTTDLSVRWLVGACALAVLLFAVLYPLAHSGLLGGGSDRDNGLNVALHALMGLSDPYYAISFLGNSVTPLPGALVLALPFYLIGNSAFQNLFWVPVFFWWAQRLFGTTSAALWCVSIFIIGCPASLRDFVTGGDYLVNALYVAIAMDAVFLASRNGRKWYLCAAAIFLAVAISSRPPYGMAVPVLAGTVFQFRGWRGLIEFLVLVGLTCAALNGPLYFHDPSHFPTVYVATKISDIPPSLHAPLVLPLIGALISLCSFFIAMNRERIFGLMALSLVPLFYFVLIYRLLNHLPGGIASVEYSSPISIFGGLWVADRFAAKYSGKLSVLETPSIETTPLRGFAREGTPP